MSDETYCWYVFGNGYIHLLPMLKEIPYGSGTVADRLVSFDSLPVRRG